MKFAPLINPKLTCFVMDENNELVAFGVAAPSIAEALKKSRGRIFPTGWAGLLHAFRVNDTLDLLLIAVRPDLQKKGVNAVIINKVMKASVKMGIKYAETGPMLETNEAIQSQWYDFPVEQHKRRRCWIKELQPAQTAGKPRRSALGQRRNNEKIWKRWSDGSAAFFVLARDRWLNRRVYARTKGLESFSVDK